MMSAQDLVSAADGLFVIETADGDAFIGHLEAASRARIGVMRPIDIDSAPARRSAERLLPRPHPWPGASALRLR